MLRWITEMLVRIKLLFIVTWLIIRVFVKYGMEEGARRLDRVKDEHLLDDTRTIERHGREINNLYDRYDEVLSLLESEVNAASSRGEKPPMTAEAQALFSEMEDLRRQIYETNQLLDDRLYLQRFKEIVGL